MITPRDKRGRFLKGTYQGYGFDKGQIPWNKNVKMSEETKKKISLKKKGIKLSEEHKKNISINNGKHWQGKERLEMQGSKNAQWKGGYENKLMHNKRRRVMKMNAEGSHTLEEWTSIKRRQNYICIDCKKKEPEITLTEDHIQPLSKGGFDYIKNIQGLCKSCNSRKNDRY